MTTLKTTATDENDLQNKVAALEEKIQLYEQKEQIYKQQEQIYERQIILYEQLIDILKSKSERENEYEAGH